MTDAIETERLVLFPYTAENLALFNSDLARFETVYGVRYRGEELDHLLTDYLKKLEREIAEDPAHYLFFTEFLIVRKENDCVIGSVDFKYVPRDGVTEVGYGLNPRFEGHGYMTEALNALLAFGRARGVKTVLADTLPDNVRSQNVLRRCGFRFTHRDGNLWWKKELDPAPPAMSETPDACGKTGAPSVPHKEGTEMDYIRFLRSRVGSEKVILNCAGAVVVRDGQILLQRRSDNGKWGLPGGLMELNETFAETALREIREETGLEVRLTAFLGVYHNHDMVWSNGDRAHVVGAYFVAEVLRGEMRIDGESLELRFFAPEDLPPLFAEDQVAAVGAYLRGVRLPLPEENRATRA